MADILTNIKCIIEELKNLKTFPSFNYCKDDDFLLPRFIYAGNGNTIIVNRKVYNGIIKIADQLMKDNPSLEPKLTKEEWRKLVRRSFGPALTKIDPNNDPTENANTVLSHIKPYLQTHLSNFGSREFAFGSTLFGNVNIKPFSIGPVRFEPRSDWLERKADEREVSATTRRRVEKAWSGKKLRKRKSSADSIRETDILDAISTCPFVCSVTTSGFAPESGREKALTAARLALTAIALLWTNPSRALGGMNLVFDRRVRHQKALAFTPGKIVLAGSQLSHLPHGPWIKTDEWEAEFQKRKDYFCVTAEILHYVIDSEPDSKVQLQ